MDEVVSADSILFEGFRLDRRSGCLFGLEVRDNSPVVRGSRALDLLRLFVERAEQLVQNFLGRATRSEPI